MLFVFRYTVRFWFVLICPWICQMNLDCMHSMFSVYMSRKYQQLWSTIPTKSTKRTTAYHLKSLEDQARMQRHMPMEFQVLVWDTHTNVIWLNWLMVFQPFALDNWISKRQYRYKQTIKKYSDSLPLEKTTHNHKDEWKHELSYI